MRSQRATSCRLLLLLLATWLVISPAYGQSAEKAIVLAWDGTVPVFVHELLRDGKLPNLAKLIAVFRAK